MYPLRRLTCLCGWKGALRVFFGGITGVLGVLLLLGFTFPENPRQKVVWPLPPDPPRVAYVTAFEARPDVGIRKGFFQWLKEKATGPQQEPRMLRPTGVFADGNGKVYVTDTGVQVVHIFDFARKDYRQVFWLRRKTDQGWQVEPPSGRLLSPIGVVVDARGRIYVSDSLLRKVYLFDPQGAWLGALPETFQRPTGLALDPQRQRLYVVDTGAHRIVVFQQTGEAAPPKKRFRWFGRKQVRVGMPQWEKIREIGHRGTAPGEFNFPTQIALDSEGRLYVTDSLNFRIQILNPEGKVLHFFGRPGNVLGTFSKPKGIAVDPEGHIYVVDSLYDTIQIFDRKGNLLMHFGSHGAGPGGFWLPIGIYIDANQYIYVADTYNQRVQVFRYLGKEAQAAR